MYGLMATKPVNLRRFPKYILLYLYKLLGLRKKADLQYVRLLEGYLRHQEIEMLYETLKEEGE